jgi:hypothetical protein
MAKTQTFGDKLKKKKALSTGINVKVIKGFKTETGSVGYVEKFVKVNDLTELEKLEV